LKGKQPTTTIEVHVICLSPLNESPAKSSNVDSIEEVVEVLDQNLSPSKINKT
jgi:hypothetical protein